MGLRELDAPVYRASRVLSEPTIQERTPTCSTQRAGSGKMGTFP